MPCAQGIGHSKLRIELRLGEHGIMIQRTQLGTSKRQIAGIGREGHGIPAAVSPGVKPFFAGMTQQVGSLRRQCRLGLWRRRPGAKHQAGCQDRKLQTLPDLHCRAFSSEKCHRQEYPLSRGQR